MNLPTQAADGWTTPASSTTAITNELPVTHIYFQPGPTPERTPWLTTELDGLSTEIFSYPCPTAFDEFSTNSGVPGCVLQDRFAYFDRDDHRYSFWGLNLGDGGFMRVVNGASTPDGRTVSIAPEAWAPGMSDQGFWLDPEVGQRLVSQGAVGTNLISVNSTNDDGSTVTMSAVQEAELAAQVLRMMTPGDEYRDVTVKGAPATYVIDNGEDVYTLIWSDAGWVVKVDATGASGRAVIEEMID